MQHQFACALTCAMLMMLVPLIAFAQTVSAAHPGSSVEVAEAYINKSRASDRQACTSELTYSLAAPSQALTRFIHGCRLVVMILLGKPPTLCHVLENMQDFAFPWTSMDLFVISPNNTAAEKLGCKDRFRTCDLAAQSPGESCTSNHTNIFFLPLQEEWRTPIEAGGRHTWQTGFSEDYRRMVCVGKASSTMPHKVMPAVCCPVHIKHWCDAGSLAAYLPDELCIQAGISVPAAAGR